MRLRGYKGGMNTLPLTATTAPSLEPLLADELRELGITVTQIDGQAVHFEGTLRDAYRAALFSRVASRVLLPLKRAHAPTANALYTTVKKIPWEEHFSLNQTFAVHFVGVSEALRNSHFAALKVKDAVADRFMERTGSRPAVDVTAPDVRIHVHLRDPKATISLDFSGVPLHQRGFDREGGPAPLRENLAAGLLRLAGWHERGPAGDALVDPLCGSGTFLSEGALMAGRIAPGLARKSWGFLAWRGHEPALWAQAREEALDLRLPPKRARLFGSDGDPDQLARAGRNLGRAGLLSAVRLARLDFSQVVAPPGVEPGVFITNPPYAERLGEEEEVNALYRQIGDTLRRQFLGWNAYILAGSTTLAKQVGLRPRRRYEVRNGALDCRLLDIPISDAPVQSKI